MKMLSTVSSRIPYRTLLYRYLVLHYYSVVYCTVYVVTVVPVGILVVPVVTVAVVTVKIVVAVDEIIRNNRRTDHIAVYSPRIILQHPTMVRIIINIDVIVVTLSKNRIEPHIEPQRKEKNKIIPVRIVQKVPF